MKPERLEAKKYYIEHGFGLSTIEKVLSKPVSRKTLYNWKNNLDGKDEADWVTLRNQRCNASEDIRQSLVDTIKSTIKEAKENNDPMLHFAVAKYIQALKSFNDIRDVLDDSPKEEVKDEKKVLSKETLAQMEKEIFGL